MLSTAQIIKVWIDFKLLVQYGIYTTVYIHICAYFTGEVCRSDHRKNSVSCNPLTFLCGFQLLPATVHVL